jgi:hypothetical protein
MSNLTEFLQLHQMTLGLAYTPLMTVYILAMISPMWSLYLLVCSLLSILPTGRFQALADLCLSTRLTIDALFNPVAIVCYWYIIPYYLGNGAYLAYFFFTNSSGSQSILPTPYFALSLFVYMAWYSLNRYVYLMTFYSPSRVFGSAAVLLALFDFEPTIAYLLWCNVYIGVAISLFRYVSSLYYAFKTANFLMTNK